MKWVFSLVVYFCVSWGAMGQTGSVKAKLQEARDVWATDPGKAIELARKATALNPDSPRAWEDLTHYLYMQDRDEEALQASRRLVSLRDTKSNRMTQARILAKMRKDQEQLEVMLEVDGKFSTTAVEKLEVAQLLMRLGSPAGAIDYSRRALNDPNIQPPRRAQAQKIINEAESRHSAQAAARRGVWKEDEEFDSPAEVVSSAMATIAIGVNAYNAAKRGGSPTSYPPAPRSMARAPAGSASRQYAYPVSDCLTVVAGKSGQLGGSQSLYNRCAFEVEATWSEPGSDRFSNAATLPSGGSYPVQSGQIVFGACAGRNTIARREGTRLWCWAQ